ncbi:MAG: thiol:disulfide interchange protein DsbA/DsbL [Halieaceae bacterium]|nr:thiol:disulfide interchange protein DsbA/DsbL [Halieaceae bacterium]
MLQRFSLTLVLLLSATFALAQDDNWVAGTHYDVISPAIRTANPDAIEVTEFFWYGCGHCYNFEPMLGQWKKTLGEDVSFQGSPAVWNAPMELHARAYYAAQVLDVMDTMHPVIFQAMNVDRRRLASESEIAALFTANGVSEEDFTKAYNSFGVSSQVRQASARAKAAQITGTPEMMVNGKYRISTRKAGGQANMLKIADFLIAKERAAAGS